MPPRMKSRTFSPKSLTTSEHQSKTLQIQQRPRQSRPSTHLNRSPIPEVLFPNLKWNQNPKQKPTQNLRLLSSQPIKTRLTSAASNRQNKQSRPHWSPHFWRTQKTRPSIIQTTNRPHSKFASPVERNGRIERQPAEANAHPPCRPRGDMVLLGLRRGCVIVKHLPAVVGSLHQQRKTPFRIANGFLA